MYEQISELINTGDFCAARDLITQEKQSSDSYNDILAILDAEVCFHFNDQAAAFDCISKGLQYNYQNYELYYMLGRYYLERNPKQAYLCYENAEYYCAQADDRAFLSQQKELLTSSGVSVPPVSVVICSYNEKEKMQLCLDSLRASVSDSMCEIVVIDNASTDGVTEYLRQQSDIKVAFNTTNVGFPAGSNQGIKLSDPYNDILLLNNDTVVMPNSIFWLRMGLYENDTIGATGSVTNSAGNYQNISLEFENPEEYVTYAATHNIPLRLPYEKKLRLIGFAMMLKRRVLDSIGLLDERFSPGNCEDDDISYRILSADYQLLLCKNSFIYHWGNSGFGKNTENFCNVLETNIDKFHQKWGFDIRYYCNERRDLASFIHEASDTPLHILEVGCGLGATLGYLQNTYPNASVYGIELMENIAQLGKNFIPTIIPGNIETMTLDYPLDYFDYIIFGDVLEHLHDPQSILAKIKKYLKPNGCVLASIPNIMHYTVLLDLLSGSFTRTDSGLLDRTHLNFFTLKEIYRMFEASGYRVTKTNDVTVICDLPDSYQKLYDSLLALPGIAQKEQFEAFQYLIKATRTNEA